ncbi:MAG: response regulator [Gemmatimonadetes bacterium]|nr:response regulator [Gemmatimonadota bacterium]
MSADISLLLIEPPLRRRYAQLDPATEPFPFAETTDLHVAPGRATTTVLVVDDEHDVRFSLRQLLEFYGYRVIEAANGAEALELLALKPVSFVITDLHMPRMNGIEFLRQVRTRSPARPRTVAMSGVLHMSQAAPAAAASILGADAVLDKPFTRHQLLQALAMAVDQDRY